jgi:hypothetical protein
MAFISVVTIYYVRVASWTCLVDSPAVVIEPWSLSRCLATDSDIQAFRRHSAGMLPFWGDETAGTVIVAYSFKRYVNITMKDLCVCVCVRFQRKLTIYCTALSLTGTHWGRTPRMSFRIIGLELYIRTQDRPQSKHSEGLWIVWGTVSH